MRKQPDERPFLKTGLSHAHAHAHAHARTKMLRDLGLLTLASLVGALLKLAGF